MIIEFVIPALLTIITASTPLVFAAIGEIVVEKSGVLNLGVEGMMIVCAVVAFAGDPYPTILLFFCIYVVAYFIVLGGMHTVKKLKDKWKDINSKDPPS